MTALAVRIDWRLVLRRAWAPRAVDRSAPSVGLDCVDETGLGHGQSVVGGFPQFRGVGVSRSVNEPDGDPFGLGRLDGGYEIAVAGDNGRVLDLMLGGESGHVEPEHEVDALLLEEGIALIVAAAVDETALADLVHGEALKGREE